MASIVEERDLTIEDGDLSTEESVKRLQAARPPLEPFNLLKEQEKVRGRIAESLVALLATLILFAFLTLWVYGSAFGDLEKLMTIIFGPVIALVGTAIGYYFGGRTTTNGTGGGS